MTKNELHNQLADPGPFAAEITALQPRLYGFILKRLADREQTLEMLQRTNLVLCQKENEFRPGSSFTAWAFQVAKFQILAWRKAEGRSRFVFSDQVYDLIDSKSEEEAEVVDQRIPLLKQCMKRLNDQDCSLIQQRYRDGQPIASLAETLDKSVDAIGMKLLRIRKQLAECVQIALKRRGMA